MNFSDYVCIFLLLYVLVFLGVIGLVKGNQDKLDIMGFDSLMDEINEELEKAGSIRPRINTSDNY